MKDFGKVDINEVYRYMGFRGENPDPHIAQMTLQIVKEIADSVSPKFCAVDTGISIIGENVRLDWFTLASSALAKHLLGCERGIIFAATLGSGVDMLIYKYSMTSPAKAVAAQAAATVLIEKYVDDICDIFSEEAAKEGLYITARFSPGYEDLDIKNQKEFLKALDADKRIGLCLTDSYMLTPVKSVTAIVGKTKTEHDCGVQKCNRCSNFNCAYKNK